MARSQRGPWRRRSLTGVALLAAAFPTLTGCAAGQPGKPHSLDEILQSEGAQPGSVPPYLIGPNCTFVTNGLTPLPWGDTH